MFVFAMTYNAVAQQVMQTETAKSGNSFSVVEKEIPVQIISINGILTVKSDEIISKVEIYSPIGGLLYQSEVNNTEFRIDNLPKTILVVRIKIGDNKPVVQKIRMQ
jgi:hypothetical protein